MLLRKHRPPKRWRHRQRFIILYNQSMACRISRKAFSKELSKGKDSPISTTERNKRKIVSFTQSILTRTAWKFNSLWACGRVQDRSFDIHLSFILRSCLRFQLTRVNYIGKLSSLQTSKPQALPILFVSSGRAANTNRCQLQSQTSIGCHTINSLSRE